MTTLANLNHGVLPKNIATLAHLNAETLEDQLKLFLLSCKVNALSPRSIEDYSQKIGAFVTFCTTQEIYKPQEVTPTHIRLFLLGMQQRCKPISVHGYYGCVCRIFNWLLEEGVLKESPMARMHPPRFPRVLIKPFKPEDIERLLLVCDYNVKRVRTVTEGKKEKIECHVAPSFMGLRNRAIILTFVDTGLRLSELAGIQLADLDINVGLITVMGKGAKERIVRISNRTLKAILRYWNQRNDDLPCLWVTEERKPLQARGIQQMVERLGKRAGITGVRCSSHTFRHSFAIMSLQNGMGEFNLQWILGHSTLTQTRRYCGSLGAREAMAAHMKASPVEHLRL